MKRKMCKRLLSGFMAVVMLFSTLYTSSAYASLTSNSPQTNKQILSELEGIGMLKDVLGEKVTDEELQEYYKILQNYGLLDENGSEVNEWDIWLDGEQVTLDDIKKILDDENCDMTHQLLVDGQVVTLGDVKTMIEIEEYISYLKETYFTPQKWTGEQQAGLSSLKEQIENSGIALTGENVKTVNDSGISHSARVSVSTTDTGDGIEYYFNLADAAEGQNVSFDMNVVSGSQKISSVMASDGTEVTGIKNIKLTADKDGRASDSIVVKVESIVDDYAVTTVPLLYYIELSNIKNALFTDGTDSKDSMTVKCTGNKNYTESSYATDWGVNPVFTPEIAIDQDDSATSAFESLNATFGANTWKGVKYGILNKLSIDGENLDGFNTLDYIKHIYGSNIYTGSYVDWGELTYTAQLIGADDKVLLSWDSGTIQMSDPPVRIRLGGGTVGGGASTNNFGAEQEITIDDFITDSSMDKDAGYKWKISGTIERSLNSCENINKIAGMKPVLSDTKAPEVVSVCSPEGTFYPGQTVPVVVRFSEPIEVSSAKATLNGVECSADEGWGHSNIVTFPYKVQEVDGSEISLQAITATDINGLVLNNESMNQKAEGAKLFTPVMSHAITAVTGECGDGTLNIGVTMSDDETMTQGFLSCLEPVSGGKYKTQTDVLAVSVDGGKTLIPLELSGETLTGKTLTASVDVGINRQDTEKSYIIEVYINKELIINKIAVANQAAFAPVTASDITPEITIKNGEENYTFENADDPVIYVQSGGNSVIKAQFKLDENKKYDCGDKKSVTVADASGKPVDDTKDFAWQATTDGVVNINVQEDGSAIITPVGSSGETQINLIALNDGIEQYKVVKTASYDIWVEGEDGNPVNSDKDGEVLKFEPGLTPFIELSGDRIMTADKNDAGIFWVSNLCDKNGDNETEFTVKLENNGREILLSDSVKYRTGTKTKPVGNVTIPGKLLTYSYDGTESNEYTVTVSAEYKGVTYSDSVIIEVSALAAEVSLAPLKSYYISDTEKSIDIEWNLKNLIHETGKTLTDEVFNFRISKGNTDILNYPADSESINVQPDEHGEASGKYTLNIEDVVADKNDPSSYRTVYTVTIQAKNGKDSTWSYDSFLLYVYDANALKIMVDGEDTDELTMSNMNTISKMSQDEILALKRDIYLKNIISVNYGEYAWNEVSDQIMWALDNNKALSVNYQQGTLYEDINNFSYVSYRPTSEIGLSGLSDGTARITAKHKMTGISDTLNVNVKTLKDKLYLLQCYPQAETTLYYTNGKGEEKTSKTNDKGEAAIYEESGIASDIYCVAEKDNITYQGTFFVDQLVTGEGDWTKLSKYPQNNLKLRRAAYAYVYVKKPDGTPYTGDVIFRGGVYINGKYKSNARFALNGETNAKSKGNKDNTVKLGKDGKLEVLMDITQWGLDDNVPSAEDKISYVFELRTKDDSYYPMIVNIDATRNEESYVNSGEAIANFSDNKDKTKKDCIAYQKICYKDGNISEAIGYKGNLGPSDNVPEVELNTIVYWWGEDTDKMKNTTPVIQIATSKGENLADGDNQYEISSGMYEFSNIYKTEYKIRLNSETVGKHLKKGEKISLDLNYYKDGKEQTLTKREKLPFMLCNMLGLGKIEKSQDLVQQLKNMGNSAGTDAKTNMGFGDKFLMAGLNLVSGDSYTGADESLFKIQLAPTDDPTKFLGLIEVNVGNMGQTDNVTGIYGNSKNNGGNDLDYAPGFREMMTLTRFKTFEQYKKEVKQDYEDAIAGKGMRDLHYTLGGYMESMIYYNTDKGKWEIKVLNGGFHAGGGASYSWNWNTFVGPVPFTATLSVGATGEVRFDALAVSYNEYKDEADMVDGITDKNYIGTDYLTELRLYMYLRFFAGVGIDYSVIAFKLGIYGQISVDMRFDWLNRPYMYSQKGIIQNTEDKMTNKETGGKLSGQKFKIDGQIGLKMVIKILFIKFEKILCSYSFNLLNKSTGQWDNIQKSWEANKGALSTLLANNSLSAVNMDGNQYYVLNLATTVEDREYLSTERTYWNSKGIGAVNVGQNQLSGAGGNNGELQHNAYPYSDPVVTDDGKLMVYMSDMGSTDTEKTRIAYATKSGDSYKMGDGSLTQTAIDDNGFGDSQASLSGTGDFAVAAWARMTAGISKDSGTVLSYDDQKVMMNGTDIYASIYDGNSWKTTRLSDNNTPDLAPVTASNGKSGKEARAIVAWRSVTSYADKENISEFDKDTIVYKIYDGEKWSDTKILYNGTSGSVKALTAAMMSDGTSAVSYTLDGDENDNTVNDREIYMAVIESVTNEVERNVRATTDDCLDENPQLTKVVFPSDNKEHFVLGWYNEEQDEESEDTVSDVKLMEFDKNGITGTLLPDSISSVADSDDVNITSDFKFTKGSETIEDLSLAWVERADKIKTEDGTDLYTENDILKSVKFYTNGQNGEIIRYTGAMKLADMKDGTLIDSFDIYRGDNGDLNSLILGTRYDSTSTETKESELSDGNMVSYEVPKSISSIYNISSGYKNSIVVDGAMADYSTVRLGAATQIQFNIKNNGIKAVKKITISAGDQKTTYKDINLLPGESFIFNADYTVPNDKVTDIKYKVKAVFEDDSTDTDENYIYLDMPDLRITQADIVKEQDGERTVQIKLSNDMDASLTNNNRKVKLSFYSDATYESEIDEAYIKPVIISDMEELKMIDEGGYSTQCVFDVEQYIKDKNGVGEEIRESGISVYIKAEILEKDSDGNYISCDEPVSSNNYDSVTCENLKVRTREDVSITSEMEVAGDSTTVNVTLQNNRLTKSATGNLMVTLLDENGNVIETKQSYRKGADNNGLIILKGEEVSDNNVFKFNHAGKDILVTYSDTIADEDTKDDDNTELASLKVSGLPDITLDKFVENEAGDYCYSVRAKDIDSVMITAQTKSINAKAVLSSKNSTADSSNILAENVSLKAGKTNCIKIEVTAGDNKTKRNYIINIVNGTDGFVMINDASKVYDGNPVEVSYVTENDTSADGSVKVEYRTDKKGSEYTTEAPVNVGKYIVRVTVAADTTHTQAQETAKFTISNASQVAPQLTSSDETIAGKSDGSVDGLTTDMQWRVKPDSKDATEKTNPYMNVTDVNMKFADGIYEFRYAAKENFNVSEATEITIRAGRKLNIMIPEEQTGYTITADKSEALWGDDVVITYETGKGYTETSGFAVKVNGKKVTMTEDTNSSGRKTCTVSNISEDMQITVEGVEDVTAPLGSISIEDNTWDKFLNTITFGVFFNKTKDVKITASDEGSGLSTIEYYISDKALSRDDVNSIADDEWVAYKEFSISPNRNCVIYARLRDKAGNTAYISSDGIVMYTDSENITKELEYIKSVSGDLEADIALNGNVPVKAEIQNDDITVTLVKDTDYTVVSSKDGEKGTVIIRESTLEKLHNGDYVLKISYNPGGKEDTGSDNESNKPADTFISLRVRNPKLLGVREPQAIAGVENGTELDAEKLGLPKTVTIETEDKAITQADVTWDVSQTADGTEYDKNCVTEQTFKLNGTIKIPDNVDNTDNLSTNVTIEVTVAAAGYVGTVVAKPAAGIYKDNQMVELDSSTESAEIYYTLDGSSPVVEVENGEIKVTNGTKYTGRISVTGIAGESVKTMIKAVAVKADMQSSAVSEFEYVINIPHVHVESDWIVDRKPTTSAEGLRHKECTICGYIIKTEKIKRLEEPVTDEPTTDETTTQTSEEGTTVVETTGQAETTKQEETKKQDKHSAITSDITSINMILMFMGVSIVTLIVTCGKRKKE